MSEVQTIFNRTVQLLFSHISITQYVVFGSYGYSSRRKPTEERFWDCMRFFRDKAKNTLKILPEHFRLCTQIYEDIAKARTVIAQSEVYGDYDYEIEQDLFQKLTEHYNVINCESSITPEIADKIREFFALSLEDSYCIATLSSKTKKRSTMQRNKGINVPIAEESYPKVHFDSRLLIPSQCFFGRDEFVKCILQKLSKNRVYLHGIGGIGKTEIVKSVVNTVLKTPIGSGDMLVRDIYWIVCDNSKAEEDVKDYIIKSVKPQTEVDNDNRNALYEECIHIINKKQTLLIVDNIEFFNDELLAFINRVQNVKLLVVGRPDAVSGSVSLDVEEVRELTPAACMQLFAFYCPYDEKKEESDVKKIVDLADSHTVSLELLAKLIRKQEKTIAEFLQVLIDCGFDLRFDGEKEQKVASSHNLLAKEDRIIAHLAKLFNTIHLTEEEKTLLIKFSTVPNLKCATQNACKWFSLSDTSALYSLANAGWIKREEGEHNRNFWYIHSIIATAVRFAHSDVLLQTCRPFICKLTDIIDGILKRSKKPNKMLIQFSWSVSDMFKDSFQSVRDDVKFLSKLGELYDRIGLLQRANYIFDLAKDL